MKLLLTACLLFLSPKHYVTLCLDFASSVQTFQSLKIVVKSCRSRIYRRSHSSSRNPPRTCPHSPNTRPIHPSPFDPRAKSTFQMPPPPSGLFLAFQTVADSICYCVRALRTDRASISSRRPSGRARRGWKIELIRAEDLPPPPRTPGGKGWVFEGRSLTTGSNRGAFESRAG